MSDNKKITLITGGIKSGKSRFALDYTASFRGESVFIATATASDDHMREKIQKHKQERGDRFVTVEEPLYLGYALKNIKPSTELVMIDCLTLWAGNLLHYFKNKTGVIEEQIQSFYDELSKCNRYVVIVTNEVGLGVIPENDMARTYMNLLGRINQDVAKISSEVIMMIAGIPQWVKGVGVYEQRVNEKI